ncbi:hypothetical protein [Oscillatoria acuminata]|uniref:Uncharacterized protein n=1 Tax=Oscillatoria acuminata PCC 6304 TaxID=56110 RepID=K9TKP8_9CYAN|nr:hypothetical protein [Oscillatoria acuminata]AFY82973.1 hypothetical protein Oscil6304_3403 [Oscillatoria acuminata PCC 6304]
MKEVWEIPEATPETAPRPGTLAPNQPRYPIAIEEKSHPEPSRFRPPILLNPAFGLDLPGGILEELERAAMNKPIAQIALHPPEENAVIAQALQQWVDKFDDQSILSFIRQPFVSVNYKNEQLSKCRSYISRR